MVSTHADSVAEEFASLELWLMKDFLTKCVSGDSWGHITKKEWHLSPIWFGFIPALSNESLKPEACLVFCCLFWHKYSFILVEDYKGAELRLYTTPAPTLNGNLKKLDIFMTLSDMASKSCTWWLVTRSPIIVAMLISCNEKNTPFKNTCTTAFQPKVF